MAEAFLSCLTKGESLLVENNHRGTHLMTDESEEASFFFLEDRKHMLGFGIWIVFLSLIQAGNDENSSFTLSKTTLGPHSLKTICLRNGVFFSPSVYPPSPKEQLTS